MHLPLFFTVFGQNLFHFKGAVRAFGVNLFAWLYGLAVEMLYPVTNAEESTIKFGDGPVHPTWDFEAPRRTVMFLSRNGVTPDGRVVHSHSRYKQVAPVVEDDSPHGQLTYHQTSGAPWIVYLVLEPASEPVPYFLLKFWLRKIGDVLGWLLVLALLVLLAILYFVGFAGERGLFVE